MWSVQIFCYCKQKTAYEMRISDWSSDVCSSDLLRETFERIGPLLRLNIVRNRITGQSKGYAMVYFINEEGRKAALQAGPIHIHGAPPASAPARPQIGRASCRERLCQYV